MFNSFVNINVSKFLSGTDYEAVFKYDSNNNDYVQLTNSDMLNKKESYWVWMNNSTEIKLAI